MTGSVLTIAAAQPACVPRDVAGNAISHAEVIEAANARVVVFPELSLTGYELDAPAVDPADPALGPIVDACAATGSVALVGAPTSDNGRDHISMVVVDADGADVGYRKMWLSDTEAQRFVPGPSPVVLEVDDWRLGLAICKDTGITEHADATAALGMDVYVAGVLDSADDAAVQEERARRVAARHHVWVVVASFAGSAGGGYEVAAAQSRIWSPDGAVAASAGPDTGRVARAILVDDRAVELDRQPRLLGELLELRPLRPSDFDALAAIASDPLLWEQHPSKDRTQRDVFEQWFHDAAASGGALVAIDRSDGRVVGTSRFVHDDAAATSEVEIGWTFLARSHWGGRYNREMKQLMLEHAFEAVDAVVFRVHSDNARSRRAVEKLGAIRVGSEIDPDGRGENDVFRLER